MRNSEVLPSDWTQSAKMSKEIAVKLVVLGSGGVGKSAFTIHYMQNIFVVEYDPTIYQKQVVLDEQCLSVEMLDTAGEEEYGVMLQQYILRSDGCIVVYSITSINSFKEVNGFIGLVLQVKDSDYFPMAIIGNKCDLESERKVETQAGENIAGEYNVAFFETSAMFGINVKEAVDTLTKRIFSNPSFNTAELKESLQLSSIVEKRRKQCVVF